jgi:hypothetical protein
LARKNKLEWPLNPLARSEVAPTKTSVFARMRDGVSEGLVMVRVRSSFLLALVVAGNLSLWTTLTDIGVV